MLRGPADRTIWPFPSGPGLSEKPLDSSAVATGWEIFAAADAQMRSKPAAYAHKKIKQKKKNHSQSRWYFFKKTAHNLGGELRFQSCFGAYFIFSKRWGCHPWSAPVIERKRYEFLVCTSFLGEPISFFGSNIRPALISSGAAMWWFTLVRSSASVGEKLKKYSRFYFEGSQSVGLCDTVQNFCHVFIASQVNFLASLFSLWWGL